MQSALWLTLGRAARGYALALIIGVIVGSIVASSKIVRSAFGSFITGLQTMPSVAWFPLALLLFKRTEAAIMFVVVLGAAPSIANGLLNGIDQIPPLYVRAGRVLGARGLTLYRRVVLPAALPGFVGGMKQGWAFAWRSLMAGELLVIIAGHQSIGVLMQNARDFSDAPALMASMIVILVVGIVVDARVLRRHRPHHPPPPRPPRPDLTLGRTFDLRVTVAPLGATVHQHSCVGAPGQPNSTDA